VRLAYPHGGVRRAGPEDQNWTETQWKKLSHHHLLGDEAL